MRSTLRQVSVPCALIACLTLISTSLQAAPKTGDALLDRAKEQHEKRVAKLEADFEKARQLFESQKEKAKQDLIRAYEIAIKRNTIKGELELANALLAEKKALIAGDDAADDPVAALAGNAPATGVKTDDELVRVPGSKASRTFFRCVLGAYRKHFAPAGVFTPYVNLSVPSGNLWTKEVQDQMRGRIDISGMAYTGTAKIYAPQNGIYHVVAKGFGVKIDGKRTDSGSLPLKKGVHEVVITSSNHGQTYLRSATIHIYADEAKTKEVPLINSYADIARFLTRPVEGVKPAEVSGWKPTKQHLVEF